MEIFSTPTDQARLITTLIATLVALSIVYLTHYFNNKSSKNELVLSKLEEIYRASLIYKKRAQKLLSIPNVITGQPRFSDEDWVKWYEYSEIKDELQVLVILYAPYLESCFNSMDEVIRRATVKRKVGDPPEGIEDNYKSYREFFYKKLSYFDSKLIKNIRQYA